MNFSKFDSAHFIQIRLASSEEIKNWAEGQSAPPTESSRMLDLQMMNLTHDRVWSGVSESAKPIMGSIDQEGVRPLICREVKKPDTLNYRSFRPEKDGLFCERIFGPINDWTCSCGQIKEQKFALDHEKALNGSIKAKICQTCQVEVTTSRFRRYRMGYISLACPVTHIWYVNARPNLFSLLLKMPTKYMKKIIYYKAYSPSLGLPEYLSACLSPGGDFFDNEWEYLHTWLGGKQASEDICSPWALNPLFLNKPHGQLAKDKIPQYGLSDNKRVMNSQGSRANQLTTGFMSGDLLGSVQHPRRMNNQGSESAKLIRKMPEFPNWLENTGAQGLLNEFTTRNWKKEIEKLRQDLGPEPFVDSEMKAFNKNEVGFVSGIRHDLTFISKADEHEHQNPNTSSFDRAYETILGESSEMEQQSSTEFNSTKGSRDISKTDTRVDTMRMKPYLKSSGSRLNMREAQFFDQTISQTEENEEDDDESSDFVGKRRKNRIRRLKILQTFQKSGGALSSLIFSCVPVLPPDLRPIIQLGPGQIASSDVNDLYRRILIRNNRLKYYLYETHFVEFLVRSEQQLVQLAVDALLENGKTTQVRHTTGQKRLYKSLTERIGGKQGRFRMNLLGKRVDYSGRSVIVVGPRLHISQCGIPYEMGLELFQAFLLRFLLEFQICKTLRAAKNILLHNKPFARQLLHRILQSYPVLLNRAPTLHRLGIQAFQPVLSFGKALRLHPLVCPAFNADFDGDQMAVHVPLSPQSRIEARILMLATGNWLSASTGQPNLLPSQDMVLGFYYMTLEKHGYQKGRGRLYQNLFDVVQAYETKELELHSQIWVQLQERNSDTSRFLHRNSNTKKPPLRFHVHKFPRNLHQTTDALGRLTSIMEHKNESSDKSRGVALGDVVSVKQSFQNIENWSTHFLNKRFARESHQPLEIRVNSSGIITSIYPSLSWKEDKQKTILKLSFRTTPGRVLFNSIFQKYTLRKIE